MPSYQSPVSSAALEHSSFVSGSRPTAPIKTAIIRPTNFYDGVTKSNLGSSPDNKLKLYSKSDYLISHSSPVACSSDIMSPLTPEADSDPLSDNCAVMYGTNATRRRKSKVEAWIESSSSAQSEESLTGNRGLLRPLRRRQAMQLSSTSSTLSKEEVDLSFENLCQELLALSASCSTLERMINKTQGEINSNQSDAYFSTDETEQKVGNVKQQQLAADAKTCKHNASNIGSSSLNRAVAEGRSGEMDHSQSNSSWQKRMEVKVHSRQEQTKPNYLPDVTQKIVNVQYHASHHCQTDLRLQNGFPSAHHDETGASLNINSSAGSRTVILPAKKLTALTIDVGLAHNPQLAIIDMPIRDSLVTVTNPQSLIKNSRSAQQFSKSYGSKTNNGCNIRESKSMVSHLPTTYLRESLSTNNFQQISAGPQRTGNSISRSKSFNPSKLQQAEKATGRPAHTVIQPAQCIVEDQERFATDHVAAAITTQPISSTPPRRQKPPLTTATFNRSLSEPTSFVTPTPEKRSSLVRSPSKKDLKSRQLLKVGMDFIRLNGGSKVEEVETTPGYTSKDNLLMNNLDICSQSKSSVTKPDKMRLPITSCARKESRACLIQPSVGSDSVFEDNDGDDTRLLLGTPVAPVLSSTCKSRQLYVEEPALGHNKTVTSQKGSKPVNESLSSSFESEALDILASLKSANALKAQLRHGKFPTDVDPVTGSPRQPTRLSNEDRNRTSSHQHSYPSSSNKSSCLSSPSGSTPPVLQHQFVVHRSPQFQPQTPSSRRSRQSCYDNVLQSPFGGMRISVASGSSSGTIFSRPWGDLPRWDDYHLHNDDFRHRVGSAVSSQSRSVENGTAGVLSSPHRHLQQHNPFRIFDKDGSRSPSYIQSVSEEREQPSHNIASVPRFPVSAVPDVALEADMNVPQQQRRRTNWELALDRTLNKVRTFTKMLTMADAGSCEITKYIHTVLRDSHSLPGTLVGRFHTCTWETNSLDRKYYSKSPRNPSRNCVHREAAPKTDWYSSNIQSSWGSERNAKSMTPSEKLAYGNSGYLLSTTSSREGSRAGEVISSVGAKEHIMLSNVRQFVDGMKRYLLNRPDTQMMVAIQRERIKQTFQMGADQLINLDAIMEAALEKVILQPLSDHLLNVITTHPDYCIREITQIESGMKIILNNRSELFSNILILTEIDAYDQTLRSVFQNMKSEFSPISKLQYLLQMALLFILVQNRSVSAPQEQDLLLMFVYAMARYGDATLIVHLAYIRHLIPSPIKNGATAHVLSLYENTVQIFSRIAKVPSNLIRRTMILNEIVEKLSCHLMIADESTNRVIRKKLSLSRWSTVSELIDIIQVDLANHELDDFKLYIVTDDKEIFLRASDNVNDLLMIHAPGDTVYSLVYRSTNTQMLLPPP